MQTPGRISNKSHTVVERASSSAGFTLLETAVALLILTIGLVALAGSISYAIAARNASRNVSEAKLMIVSTLEQMEMLRNTGRLTFGQIANTGGVDNAGGLGNFAGFPTAFRAVRQNPGNDGIYGTTDDNGTTQTGYTRSIVITALPVGADIRKCNLKKIVVTVRYPGQSGLTQELVGVGYLNNDQHGNYIR